MSMVQILIHLIHWKVRHNIVFRKKHGEKQDADLQLATDRKHDVHPENLHGFNKDNIYNTNETGLCFHGYPDKENCIKGAELAGGKKEKDRIAVLLCANMSRTDKLPLFVIGKSKLPRCYSTDLRHLPVEYESSKNA